MRFGYACLNEELQTKVRRCILATYRKEGNSKLKDLTIENLKMILKTLKWNVLHNIYFFRVTSNIIPLGTHQEVNWNWQEDEDVMRHFNNIKTFVQKHNIRLSCHPGQYSVLNTLNPSTLKNTILDFEMHSTMMDLLGGTDMITHTGGAYGNKIDSLKRFADVYETLSPEIRKKLRLENDDKTFNVEDVLYVYDLCGIPICLDIHHHNCNPSKRPIEELIHGIFDTWLGYGIPKVHISSGKTGRKDSSHHDYIHPRDLEYLLEITKGYDIDIMIEAKKKEQTILLLEDREELLKKFN